jgi:hypothetical protein
MRKRSNANTFMTKTKNVSYIDFRLNTPWSLAWLVAWRQKLMVPRTDCCTVQTVLLGAVHSQVPARPAAWQIFNCFMWELQAGGNGICLCLSGVLL